MARITIKDGHAIMNLMIKQATGQDTLKVVDSSTFVSAGNELMSLGMETVYNSLTTVLARTMIAVRAYDAKLKLMDAIDTGVYSNLIRKISYYASDVLPDGHHNTDLFTNLANGFTAGENKDAEGAAQSTKSQFEQVNKEVLERNFGQMSTVWQHAITLYEDQVQVAFRDEAEFAAFIEGLLLEHQNDIEQAREAWNGLALVNKIGEIYDLRSVMPGSAIDLTAGFNAKYNTNYTRAELLSTYLKEFAQYFTAEFKKVSRHMKERSKNFHWSPAAPSGNTNLLRFTPVANQRVYLLEDIWTDVEASVYSEIFNPSFLDINTQYQPVGYWQNENDRSAVKVVPAIPDISGETKVQTAGAEVNLPCVIGLILDNESLMTNFQLESARTSPLEARKGYRTTWLSIAKSIFSDATMNGVLFYMS